jgi:ribonuclease D
MTNKLYRGDLPADLSFGPIVAIDTETMGLNPHRDRLCLVQLSAGDGNAHLVQIPKRPAKSPRLAALLADPKVLKLFHFGRFDIAVLEHALGVRCEPVYCTKIAAKLTRTFTDKFGPEGSLQGAVGRRLCQAAADLRLGADTLSEEQLAYAAPTCCICTRSRPSSTRPAGARRLNELAQAAFRFLPSRARLDLAGWPPITDIFEHRSHCL